MKLSVIIPVHNAAPYLGACLDSVLNQSLTDLEVICVDDASTDDSVSIAKKYCQRDPRVLLIQNPMVMYAGPCRNVGLLASQGEYVHFLDSDDLVEKDAYEIWYRLAKEADADLVKGKSRCFDNETNQFSTTPLFDLSQVPQEAFGHVTSFLEQPRIFSHISVVPWNGFYKRTFLLENNIWFNPLICVNDRSFYNEAVILAKRILIIKEKLVKYRINNSQSLVGARAKNFQCQIQSFSIVKNQCRKHGVTGEPLGIILERELVDLFIWYRKYKDVPQVQENVRALTKAFAQDLDISPLKEMAPHFKWYYDYLLLTCPVVLTVALHLTHEEETLRCLKDIQKQTMGQFVVYGISQEECPSQTEKAFLCVSREDHRFKEILPLWEIPKDTPYFFEIYPGPLGSKEFKNRIKQLMERAADLSFQELVIAPSQEKKTSSQTESPKPNLFLRALGKCRRMLSSKEK